MNEAERSDPTADRLVKERKGQREECRCEGTWQNRVREDKDEP